MSYKVTKLTVGKGKTISDEKAGEWLKEYYQVEVEIQNEKDIEAAKASVAGLLDIWLRGESITQKKAAYDVSKIKWTETEGSKGFYEKSDDVNNPEFKALIKDLADHKGKFNRNGYFYWTFQNGSTIGRKKLKPKA